MMSIGDQRPAADGIRRLHPKGVEQSGKATFARASRVIALCLLAALIALGLAWELWLAPTGRGTLAIKVLPLVLCAAGLLRDRLYTFRWLSLLLWLYVAEGLVRAASGQGAEQLLATAEVLLCFALFGACVVHIRRRPGAGAASELHA